MKPIISYSFLLVSIILGLPTMSLGQPEKKIADAFANHVASREFSGELLVAHNGKVIFQKCAGFADLEKNIEITPETRFSVGSVGKMMTGLMILQLVEKGKVKLDDPVNTYVPSWSVPNGDLITIRHLLTHRSGLGDYMAAPAYERMLGKPATIDQLMTIVVSQPVSGDAPGSKFKYNNSGFIVLGKIIESLDKTSYFEALNKRILKPAGIKSATFTVDFSSPSFAKGYAKDEASKLVPQQKLLPPSSDGGLFITAGDMLKFDQALYNYKIVSKTSLDSMHSGDATYGMATMLARTEHGTFFGHNGGLPGYGAEYRHFFVKDDQYTVVMFANRNRSVVGLLNDLIPILDPPGEK